MKSVLVTGGASGIGRSISVRLAQEGSWNVISVDKEPFNLDFDNISEYKCDIRSESSIKELKDDMGGTEISCLINNAGISVYSSVEDTRMEDMKDVYEVNVYGLKRMYDQFLDDIISNNGKIINISSLQAQFGTPGRGVYSSSKHAVKGLSDAMRNELDPMGVDVVLIEPGATETSIRENRVHRDFSRKEYEDLIGQDKAFDRSSIFTIKPVRVADYVVRVANSNNPKPRYRVGWDSNLVAILERLPTSMRDVFYRLMTRI